MTMRDLSTIGRSLARLGLVTVMLHPIEAAQQTPR